MNPGLGEPLDEPPGLYWYHPYIHGFSEAALQGGASGAIIVDEIEAIQPLVSGLPARTLIIRDLVTRKIDTGPFGDNVTRRDLAVLKTTGLTSFATTAARVDDVAPKTETTMPAIAGTPGAQRFAGLLQAPVTADRKLYFSEVLSDPDDPASPTNFYITVHGATPTLFDAANPPAITTHQGAVETWTIENRAEELHEFHIHQINFLVMAVNGVLVPPEQQQFLDTINVPYWSGTGPYPSVTVKMDFRGETVGDFVYHCHILGHEDNGMMAIIRVLPKAS